MKKRLVPTLLLALLFQTILGCSSVGPRKYIFFGDPQPEKVEMFEDYWEDYPFRPDDPTLPLRRGKGGVIRFFKKGCYTKSIMVDGDLTVNVYYSVEDGVALTQPDAQMVLTSEELNQKHRKYNKETGYSYHVYLDLGLLEQPKEEITILSIFKDAKTGQATLSKEIRTTTLGNSEPIPKKKKNSRENESEAEKIARMMLGGDETSENPIAELQARYALKNRQKKAEFDANKGTRLIDTVDVSDSKFKEIGDTPLQTYGNLLESQRERDEQMRRVLESGLSKENYYREKRRQDAENYKANQAAKGENLSSLRAAPGASNPIQFDKVQRSYIDLQQTTSRNYGDIARQLSGRALEEYDKGPQNVLGHGNTTPSSPAPSYETDVDGAKKQYIQKQTEQEALLSNPLENGFERTSGGYVPEGALKNTQELDMLNEFQPDASAPPTEIYLKK
ncbi:MAG: hypothetical protein ACI4SW_02930 [Thermoguttaceae bacterium]